MVVIASSVRAHVVSLLLHTSRTIFYVCSVNKLTTLHIENAAGHAGRLAGEAHHMVFEIFWQEKVGSMRSAAMANSSMRVSGFGVYPNVAYAHICERTRNTSGEDLNPRRTRAYDIFENAILQHLR